MPESPDTPDRRPGEEPEPPRLPSYPSYPGTWPPSPGGWQPPARPGVIPLRPLGVGDILGGAIATMRTRAGLMLGVTVVVVAVTQVLSLAATYPLLVDLSRTITSDPYLEPEDALLFTGMTLLVALIGLVFTVVSRVFLTGLFTVVIGTAVLGERPRFGEVVARLRPRLLPLLGLTLVYPIVLGAAIAVVAVVMMTGPLGVLVLLGMLVLAVWLWTLFSLAVPALVLEGVGVGQAFGRSRDLVRGSWWRIFGITLLAAVIGGAVMFFVSLPFEAIGGGFATTAVPLTAKYLVLSTIGAVIASTIAEPFVAGVTALLYTDQRMRLERLDVELTRMAGTAPPPPG